MAMTGFMSYDLHEPQDIEMELNISEVSRLLVLLGHDFFNPEVYSLTKKLYKLYAKYIDVTDPKIPINLNEEELFYIHKNFSPNAWGEDWKTFRLKIANAYASMDKEMNDGDLVGIILDFPIAPEYIDRVKNSYSSSLKVFMDTYDNTKESMESNAGDDGSTDQVAN